MYFTEGRCIGEVPCVAIGTRMNGTPGEIDGGRSLEATKRGGFEEGALTLLLDDSYMWWMAHR
jgi:hypothetical protein